MPPGTYGQRLNFRQKHLTLRSTDPSDPAVVAATVLSLETTWDTDGGAAITIAGGQGRESVLAGLTIAVDGYLDYGVLCDGTSPTISHCHVSGKFRHAAIGAVGSTAARICDNTVTNLCQFGGGAIACEATAGQAIAAEISRNAVAGSQFVAIAVTGSQTSGEVTIRDNEIRDCLLEGVSVRGCPARICGNTIRNNGLGIRCDGCDALAIEDNVVSGNGAAAPSIFGGGWGGVSCTNIRSLALRRNLVTGNVCQEVGMGSAGVNIAGCGEVELRHCLIADNSGPQALAGGLAVDAREVLVANCTLAGNSCGGGAGGLWLRCIDRADITDTIISHNAGYGCAVAEPGLAPVFSYCDVYANSAGNFNNVPDPVGRQGNIAQNPLFGASYRLRSSAGRWSGTAWVTDAVCSPCLDAGDPTSPFADEPSPNGGRVNMGYDGDTGRASRTPRPAVVTATPKHLGALPTVPFTATFNVTMRRNSVESNFSISPARAGAFSWAGKRLTFTPSTPWTADRRYVVTIAKAARSTAGMGMAADFTWAFRSIAAAPSPAPVVAAIQTPSTVAIVTTLAAPATVGVAICNLAGRTIATLPDRTLPSGTTTLLWHRRSNAGTAVPAGQYVVVVTARISNGSTCQIVTPLQLR